MRVSPAGIDAGGTRHGGRLGARSDRLPTRPDTALSVGLKKSAALSKAQKHPTESQCSSRSGAGGAEFINRRAAAGHAGTQTRAVGHRAVVDRHALWRDHPARPPLPRPGSRRCACCQPDPRGPPSAPGSRSPGRAAGLVDVDLAAGPTTSMSERTTPLRCRSRSKRRSGQPRGMSGMPIELRTPQWRFSSCTVGRRAHASPGAS